MELIQILNEQFGIDSRLHFRQIDNTILLEVDTSSSHATISLEGGHVVHWHPKSQVESVLWVSKLAQYVPGTAIRGGVPICWPWFGAHPSETQLPGHGYARVAPWTVDSTSIDANDVVDIKLTLADSEAVRKLRPSDWPQAVSLSVRFLIGETLEVSLTTTNNSDREVCFTEGLHTYLKVADVSEIRINGLDGVEYVDLIDKNTRRHQEGPITFNGELGRIYMNTRSTCIIEDPILNRCIKVEKSGSLSTAVWNPWTKTAAKMADLGAEGWRSMVCVEGANALENFISLQPKTCHTQIARYSAERISNI